MTITSTFSAPFFTGSSPTSALVPHKFDVAIAGRGYMLDRKVLAQQPLLSSIRATRAQSDQSQEPGEQSLNPDDLWRRTQQSWHFGAGQDYLDRQDSDRRRFRASKGVNPWTEGQVSLLNSTDEKLNSSNTNLALMPAGSRLYIVDGTALKYMTEVTTGTPSPTTVTGTSGSAITSIASDGFNVWVTDGTAVYKTDTGVGSAASWSLEDADVLGYVKGRLMFSDGPEIGYFSDMATPAATSLFTHAASSFTWVGFAEGPGAIYAAGYAGDKSLIYRIGIQREGVALDAPTVAGELPDGERIHAIGSYLGFLFLGTSLGARFCTLDGQGNLTIGRLIRTGNPVKCFEGQGEFVWFGWTNYDGTSTGLGRMSLVNFSDTAAEKPAYASDLMVTTQATILSVCTFTDLRVFAVSGDGIYAEDTSALVASGTLDSGRLNFGITEKKVPLYLDVTYASGFAGTVTSSIAVDGSTTFTQIGVHSTGSTDDTADTFSIGEDRDDQVEIRQTLARASSPTTSGPTVLRHTIRAQPVPQLRLKLTLPIMLSDKVDCHKGGKHTYDVPTELSFLQSWRSTKQVVTAQVGDTTYSVSLDDFDYIATQPTADRDHWQGVCIAQFKTV